MPDLQPSRALPVLKPRIAHRATSAGLVFFLSSQASAKFFGRVPLSFEKLHEVVSVQLLC